MIAGARQRPPVGAVSRRTTMHDDGSSTPLVDPAWLNGIARAAAEDAAAPVDLLGRYLWALADAAVNGDRLDRDDLLLVAASGRSAATRGVAPGQAVNLYLAAARRFWGEL